MTDRRSRQTPPQRAAGGYAVEGEGFYVWEEDAAQARRAGEALLQVLDGRRVRQRGQGGSSSHSSTEPA